MNKIVQGILVFVAVFLILLGFVFLMAYDATPENPIIGGVMLLVAFSIFMFIYFDARIQAKKPTLVSQTFNVKMGGSGQLKQKQMKCKSCGAPVEDKDLKVIDGGVMYTCSYCGTVGAFEEEPKW